MRHKETSNGPMIRHDGAGGEMAEGKAGPHLLRTIFGPDGGGEEKVNQLSFCVCALTHKVRDRPSTLLGLSLARHNKNRHTKLIKAAGATFIFAISESRSIDYLEPAIGVEPTTFRLRIERSTN
jgi:hypothetical protein